jgi:hypothetical protein
MRICEPRDTWADIRSPKKMVLTVRDDAGF